jgi:hypothetical protein
MMTMHVENVKAIQPGVARFYIKDPYGAYEIAVDLNKVSKEDLAQHLYDAVLALRDTYAQVGMYEHLKVSDLLQLAEYKKVIDGVEYQLALGDSNVSE